MADKLAGAGRQSPDPTTQHPGQGTQPTAPDPNKQGAAPSLEHGKESSETQKADKLPSNPGGNVMEDKAKDKVSKAL